MRRVERTDCLRACMGIDTQGNHDYHVKGEEKAVADSGQKTSKKK